jgi:2-C-methyl-D-erythritol 2,4-cyclodiphosphate synthase
MLHSQGWSIDNIDATVITEEPRLSPFFETMKANIAEALAIDKSCIGLKAKTNEGLGFLGKGESIAACAVASVEKR